MYGEDLDLGLRLWLAGHRVGLVPAARVTHSYEFDKGSGKWFWLERNRWRTVLSVYPTALLVLLVPALLAAELGLLAVAAAPGLARREAACPGRGDHRPAAHARAPARGAGHAPHRRHGVRELPDLLAGQPLFESRRQSLAERAPSALLATGPPAPCPCWRADARRARPPLPRARRDRRARDLCSRTRARTARARARARARGVRQPRRRPATGGRAGRRRARRGRSGLGAQPGSVGARGARAGVGRGAPRARGACCTRWRTSRPPGGASVAWSRSTISSTGRSPSCSLAAEPRRAPRRSCRWRRAVRSGSSRSPPPALRRSSPGSASSARAIDVVPNGVRPPLGGSRAAVVVDDRRAARAPPARTTARSRSRSRRNLPAQEPAGADRRARADRPGRAPAAGDRRPRHRRRPARRRRRHAAGVEEDVRLLGHCSTAELDVALRARHLPRAAHAARGLRAARARGDGALAAGRLLGHPRAARGRRLGRAVLRSPLARPDRRGDRRADRRHRPRGADCASWDVPSAARFSWAAAAAGTLESYRRALET